MLRAVSNAVQLEARDNISEGLLSASRLPGIEVIMEQMELDMDRQIDT